MGDGLAVCEVVSWLLFVASCSLFDMLIWDECMYVWMGCQGGVRI